MITKLTQTLIAASIAAGSMVAASAAFADTKTFNGTRIYVSAKASQTTAASIHCDIHGFERMVNFSFKEFIPSKNGEKKTAVFNTITCASGEVAMNDDNDGDHGDHDKGKGGKGGKGKGGKIILGKKGGIVIKLDF